MSLHARHLPFDPYTITTPAGAPEIYYPTTMPPRFDLQALKSSTSPLVVAWQGQSNGANGAAGLQYSSTNPGKIGVVDPRDGKVYQYLSGPMMGATGTGRNWMLEAADRLIASGKFRCALFIGVACVGGAGVEQFGPGQFGNLKHRLLVSGQRLKDLGLRPSCWNFALGESAFLNYTEAQFRTPLDAMINWVRSYGYVEPWVLDITTRNTLTSDPSGTNPGPRAALQHAPNGVDILAGVDTDDMLYPDYRLDEGGARVHLNNPGHTEKSIRKAANFSLLKPLFANPII